MTAVVITLFTLVASVFYYNSLLVLSNEWNKLIKDGILPKPQSQQFSQVAELVNARDTSPWGCSRPQ